MVIEKDRAPASLPTIQQIAFAMIAICSLRFQ
jgi:hypothetical protein